MKKIPSYRRKKVGKHVYGLVVINGHEIYLGKWNSKASKEEYERLIGEYLAAGRTGSESKPVTVVEIAVDYARHMKTRYRTRDGKPSNEYRIVKRVMKVFRTRYGSKLAKDFRPTQYKAIRKHFVDEGLSRNTVNRYVWHIVRCYRLAQENEKVPTECWQALLGVERLQRGASAAAESKKIKPVPKADVDKTVENLHPIAADMVRIQLLTGMRPGELCQLRPIDIDRSKETWVFVPEHHKNEHRGHERPICIGKQAQAILAPYLFRGQDQYCFQPAEAVEQMRRRRNLERKTPPNQGNKPGTNRKREPKRKPTTCYDVRSYRQAIRRAAKNAGVPLWNPNQLRKLAGTVIRRETGSLEAAQAVLGHRQKATTERFYAELDISLAAEVMSKIG